MALEANERPNKPIAKFESMLKTDDVYFFDAEDFEDIIHHYLNHGKIALAKKAIKISLKQHPDSIELKLLDVEQSNSWINCNYSTEPTKRSISKGRIYIQKRTITQRRSTCSKRPWNFQRIVMIFIPYSEWSIFLWTNSSSRRRVS